MRAGHLTSRTRRGRRLDPGGRPLPQDRELYNDGDRSLTERWRDKPYSDVEPPHPNADTAGMDAEPGEPVERLTGEEGAARRAAVEILAQGDDEARQAEEDAQFRLDDAAYGSGKRWSDIAPYVDAVVDLMQNTDSRQHLDSWAESSSLGGEAKSTLLKLVGLAERQRKRSTGGDWYRRGTKDWEAFKELVPAVGQMLLDPRTRGILGQAFAQIDPKTPRAKFVGSPEKVLFNRIKFAGGGGGAAGAEPSDAQVFYREQPPGEVPRQETRNVQNFYALQGEPSAATASKIIDTLGQMQIVSYSGPEAGKFSMARLQSAARYALERPDTPQGIAVVVGALVSETLKRISGGTREQAFAFDEAGSATVHTTPEAVLGGMAGPVRRLLDQWLSMAVSIMRSIGPMPSVSDEEAESGRERGEEGEHAVIKGRMERSLAGIAIKATERMLEASARAKAGEGRPEGDQPDADRKGPPAPGGADAEGRLKEIVLALGDAADAAGQNAMRGKSEIVKAGDVIHGWLRELGSSQAIFQEATETINKLRQAGDNAEAVAAVAAELADVAKKAWREHVRGGREASMTVADMAKQILAPAKSERVTRDDAEEGVELSDGQVLKLAPTNRYHAVSQALLPEGVWP